MAVEVIIKRRFVKDKAAEVAPLMVKLRSLARVQPGYISSESLKCIDPPEADEYVVRSTWQSAEDWKNWLKSEERTALQKKINSITREKTDFRIYEPLAGGIFPTYKA